MIIVSMLIAVQTFFAGAFNMLSPINQQFILNNLDGVVVVTDWQSNMAPYANGWYMYTLSDNNYVYIDEHNINNNAYNAEILCHEAAHKADGGHPEHDNFVLGHQLSCWEDVRGLHILGGIDEKQTQ